MHHKVWQKKTGKEYKMGAGDFEGRLHKITPILLKYLKLFAINRQYAFIFVVVEYFASI